MEFDMLPEFVQNAISEVRNEISANAGTVNIGGSDFDFAGFIGANADTQDSLIQAGINNALSSQSQGGTTSTSAPATSAPNVSFEPSEEFFGGRVNLNFGSGQTQSFTFGGSSSFSGGFNASANGDSFVISPAPGLSFDISAFLA